MEDTRLPRGSGAALLSDTASPAHLRVDLWNRVREGAERLASGRPDANRAELEEPFHRLEEVERSWVYANP